MPYTDPYEPAPSWLAPIFTTLLLTAFGTAFWVCLVGSLDQMTLIDCNRGVMAACEQLEKHSPHVLHSRR